MLNHRTIILQLLGDELADAERRTFESVDQVLGAIVYELFQLASPADRQNPGVNAEQILDHLVRVAAHAACGAADLGLRSPEEESR